MASVGRIAVSGLHGSQETTLALANINLDFSMIKLESPAEFRGLGNALSKKRKQEAEDGSTHRTARKLGLLFADDLPKTPELAKAYGLRASEIAENRQVNPKSSPNDGPFAEYVGADGTSIWAAATSGKGALAVHLLACMLARIWSPAEATSIWSEIVATRKEVLLRRITEDEEFSISTVTATHVEISRENLREWDSSARAVCSWFSLLSVLRNLVSSVLHMGYRRTEDFHLALHPCLAWTLTLFFSGFIRRILR